MRKQWYYYGILFIKPTILFADLLFVGSATYGIKMTSTDLSCCEEAGKTSCKLALNLLQMLVTPEECTNMTVYGHKNKRALPANIRAIKSHVFNIFHRDLPDKEQHIVWEATVVKMNDKLRAIKNGKYKC